MIDTPLDIIIQSNVIGSSAVINSGGGGDVAVIRSGSLSPGFDSGSSDGDSVFAVWTPVPEPSTSLLMGLGLLGLNARKRRES